MIFSVFSVPCYIGAKIQISLNLLYWEVIPWKEVRGTLLLKSLISVMNKSQILSLTLSRQKFQISSRKIRWLMWADSKSMFVIIITPQGYQRVLLRKWKYQRQKASKTAVCKIYFHQQGFNPITGRAHKIKPKWSR